MAIPWSARENLKGAQEDVDALGAEIVAFFAHESYRVVHDHNADLTEHTLRMQFIEPFPSARWGRKFGQVLNGLADALDNLIYAIGVHESGQNPPPDAGILQFPVLTNPPDGPPMWRVASLSDEVRAAILREQPDPGRLEDSALWQLTKLNNSKKHQVIHLASTRHAMGEVLLDGLLPGTHTFTWHLTALEDEAPFLTAKFDRPQPDVQMGSATTGYICVERIGGRGQPEDFLPLDGVCGKLLAATRGIIERTGSAAGL